VLPSALIRTGPPTTGSTHCCTVVNGFFTVRTPQTTLLTATRSPLAGPATGHSRTVTVIAANFEFGWTSMLRLTRASSRSPSIQAPEGLGTRDGSVVVQLCSSRPVATEKTFPASPRGAHSGTASSLPDADNAAAKESIIWPKPKVT